MFRFNESDIKYLRSLALDGNELYDFSDDKTKEIYASLIDMTEARVEARDTTSFQEIKDCVHQAAAKHKGDGIVLLSGAYPHMIGAISHLIKKYNIVYVPVGEKISTETLDTASASVSGKISESILAGQIKRDIGVTKHLNFNNMEELRSLLDLQKIDANKQTLVIIAAHETGLHIIHINNRTSTYQVKLYKQLTDFINNSISKPFICFVEEDLNVEGMKCALTKDHSNYNPMKKFLAQAHQANVSVEIGAFGHTDRRNHDYVRVHQIIHRRNREDLEHISNRHSFAKRVAPLPVLFYKNSQKVPIIYTNGSVEDLGNGDYAQSREGKRYIYCANQFYKIIDGTKKEMDENEIIEFQEAINSVKESLKHS